MPRLRRRSTGPKTALPPQLRQHWLATVQAFFAVGCNELCQLDGGRGHHERGKYPEETDQIDALWTRVGIYPWIDAPGEWQERERINALLLEALPERQRKALLDLVSQGHRTPLLDP